MELRRIIQGTINKITPLEPVVFLGVRLPATLVDYTAKSEKSQFLFYGDISNPENLKKKDFVLQETRPDAERAQIPISQRLSVLYMDKSFRTFRFSRSDCE